MKKPKVAARQASRGGSARIRRAIFGERKAIALRMTEELNEKMMAYCDTLRVAANSYVNGLIESALARGEALTKTSKTATERSAKKLTVSVRLDPAVHARLNTHCNEQEVSVNAFVCGLVRADLAQRAELAGDGPPPDPPISAGD